MKLYGLRPYERKLWLLSIAFTSQQWTGWGPMQAAAETAGQDIGERETNTGPQINEEPDAYQRKPQNAWWLTNMIPINPNVPDHLPDMYSMTVLFIWAWLVYGVCDPQTGHPGLAALSSVTFTTPDKLGKVYQNMLETQQGRNNRTQYEAGLVTEAFIEVHSEITGLDKTLSHAAVFPRWVDYMPNPQMWRQAIKSGKFVTNASRLRRNVIARVMEGQYDMVNAFSSGQNGPVGQV
ncbi:putative virion structural protein [Salmonella phage SPFM12]|nr:putative virion structural protein [Salmonella phage SPFM12]